jgi:glycosyltransferase involved in cell wall biosynthesis
VTPDRQAAWFASYLLRDDDLVYVIETLGGRPLGSVSLYHIDRVTRSAEFGRLMMDCEAEGRGYAEDACRALLGHAFTGLGVERIHLQVLCDNTRALALYERLGFAPDHLYDQTIQRDHSRIRLLGMSLTAPTEVRYEKTAIDRAANPIDIVVVHPGLTPSTCIRLLSPLSWLRSEGLVTFRLVAERELLRARRELPHLIMRGHSTYRETRREAEGALSAADIAIIQRSTSPAGIKACAVARSGGAGVVYECDDNFLAIGKDTPAVGAYYNSRDVRRCFVQLLSSADVVTTSTGILSEAFGQYAADVRTLPNCVDFSHLNPGPRADAPSFVIGYAGTVTHGPDFECVAPALRRLLDEGKGDIRLEFFGFIPETLRDRPDVGFIPFSEDYPGFLRALSVVDWSCGIAPLADLPVNHAKTDNKYREYGACRIAAVYSDCPAYARSVVDGVTGLLVPHTEEGWYGGIRRMMEDADMRRGMAYAAHDDVVERYSVAAAARAWLQTLRDVVSKTQR